MISSMEVGLSVCLSDWSKCYQLILMKHSGQVEHGPWKSPLHFSGDPDLDWDLRIFVTFFDNAQISNK